MEKKLKIGVVGIKVGDSVSLSVRNFLHCASTENKNGGNGSCGTNAVTVREARVRGFRFQIHGIEMGESKNQQKLTASEQEALETDFPNLHFHRPTPRRPSPSPRPLRRLQLLYPKISHPTRTRTRTRGHPQAPHCSVSQRRRCLCLLQPTPR